MLLKEDYRKCSMSSYRQRKRALHNFNLGPRLNWGNQRYLKCIRFDCEDEISVDRSGSPAYQSPVTRRRWSNDLAEKRKVFSKFKIESNEDEEGIELVREKLIFDLRTAADRMKYSILRDDLIEEEEVQQVEAAAAPQVVEETRPPWNLRARKAACKGQIGKGGVTRPKIERRVLTSSSSGLEKERTKFSVTLSRKEIEEDFKMMTGVRPSRRPKKRVKTVQKELDFLFPGLFLTEITADTYKVQEHPEKR